MPAGAAPPEQQGDSRARPLAPAHTDNAGADDVGSTTGSSQAARNAAIVGLMLMAAASSSGHAQASPWGRSGRTSARLQPTPSGRLQAQAVEGLRRARRSAAGVRAAFAVPPGHLLPRWEALRPIQGPLAAVVALILLSHAGIRELTRRWPLRAAGDRTDAPPSRSLASLFGELGPTRICLLVTVACFVAQGLTTDWFQGQLRQLSFAVSHPTLDNLLGALMHVLGREMPAVGLTAWGLKDNAAIGAGELHRLLSPVLLHANLLHLLVNLRTLQSLGGIIEYLYGGTGFVLIYLAAAAAGNLGSYLCSAKLAVGASGAIFGLMGALMVLARGPLLAEAGRGLGLNLVLGALVPLIDNWAHIGGLVGGYVVGVALVMARMAVAAARQAALRSRVNTPPGRRGGGPPRGDAVEPDWVLPPGGGPRRSGGGGPSGGRGDGPGGGGLSRRGDSPGDDGGRGGSGLPDLGPVDLPQMAGWAMRTWRIVTAYIRTGR